MATLQHAWMLLVGCVLVVAGTLATRTWTRGRCRGSPRASLWPVPLLVAYPVWTTWLGDTASDRPAAATHAPPAPARAGSLGASGPRRQATQLVVDRSAPPHRCDPRLATAWRAQYHARDGARAGRFRSGDAPNDARAAQHSATHGGAYVAHGLQAMHDITATLGRSGIDASLWGGSALGYHRQCGMTEYTTDIDLMVDAGAIRNLKHLRAVFQDLEAAGAKCRLTYCRHLGQERTVSDCTGRAARDDFPIVPGSEAVCFFQSPAWPPAPVTAPNSTVPAPRLSLQVDLFFCSADADIAWCGLWTKKDKLTRCAARNFGWERGRIGGTRVNVPKQRQRYVETFYGEHWHTPPGVRLAANASRVAQWPVYRNCVLREGCDADSFSCPSEPQNVLSLMLLLQFVHRVALGAGLRYALGCDTHEWVQSASEDWHSRLSKLKRCRGKQGKMIPCPNLLQLTQANVTTHAWPRQVHVEVDDLPAWRTALKRVVNTTTFVLSGGDSWATLQYSALNQGRLTLWQPSGQEQSTRLLNSTAIDIGFLLTNPFRGHDLRWHPLRVTQEDANNRTASQRKQVCAAMRARAGWQSPFEDWLEVQQALDKFFVPA